MQGTLVNLYYTVENHAIATIMTYFGSTDHGLGTEVDGGGTSSKNRLESPLIYIYIYIYIYVCVCVCVWVYIYIYKYKERATHIVLYIYNIYIISREIHSLKHWLQNSRGLYVDLDTDIHKGDARIVMAIVVRNGHIDPSSNRDVAVRIFTLCWYPCGR